MIVIRDTHTNERTVATIYFDGDFDGPWTLTAHPEWRKWASSDDDDVTGIFRSSDYSADALLDVIWDTAFLPAARIPAAEPFPEFDQLLEDRSLNWHYMWDPSSKMTPYYAQQPWKSTEDLNASKLWEVVTTRTDVMSRYPGHNAIIECANRYYLATLENTVGVRP
jgi:hypothetical protein